MPTPIRVLIVDDSPFVREVLSAGLSQDATIEVVGAAGDPYAARDEIIRCDPDVITLDVEMPRMNGVEFLRKLMPQHPLPVVMVSAFTERGKRITLDALEAGAVDFVTKPKAQSSDGFRAMLMELRTKIKIAVTANVAYWKHHRPAGSAPEYTKTHQFGEPHRRVIAIGASTGGTEAIRMILEHLPENTPGIVCVQHMPEGFTKMFADRLNELCPMEVKEAVDGDEVIPGRALIAPGSYQLRVVGSGTRLRAEVGDQATVCGHCPSVEVLMRSVATSVGADAVGVMLTGMGRDGADGMKVLRDTGARCLAQDEASSVVFGMPKEAYEAGGAERLVPLNDIAGEILRLLA